MYLCRRILLIETLTKLCVYFCVITIISVVTDHFPFPRSYFSDKQNFINQYFVKLGWGWTCSLLGLFVYLTSNTYCCGNRKDVNRHLMRLAFGTLWWFLCTKLFAVIQDSFGICVTDYDLNRSSCEASGNRWVPFDVSGHTFLLVHCLLIISEEVKCINGWERIDEVIRKEMSSQASRYSSDDLTQLKALYDENTPRIRFLILVLTLLSLMWEMMLLSTILYFHNLAQKLVGACFAALGWFISYRFWYKWRSWTPGLAGHGVIKYM